MERWMIVYLLPLEVWMDIFCFPWISRSEFGQLVARIGNFKYAEHAQFYLHEWGKHSLDRLDFTKQGVMKRELTSESALKFQPLGYPQTAMPENIRFCKYFQIGHFDNQVFNFFRRIQSLLTADTQLGIPYPDIENQVDNVRFILGHLLPFIDSIHTITTDDRLLPVVNAFPPEKFHNIKVFNVMHFVQSSMQPIVEWLTTSNSNGPKLLQVFCFFKHSIGQRVLEAIRKQFGEATQPSTFAVIFCFNQELLDFHSENGIGERLDGIRNGNGQFKIFRHQANNAQAGDKLREWLKQNTDEEGKWTRKPYIRLCGPNIGEGPVFAMPDLDVDEADDKEKEEDEDEQPSTSKKRRICE